MRANERWLCHGVHLLPWLREKSQWLRVHSRVRVLQLPLNVFSLSPQTDRPCIIQLAYLLLLHDFIIVFMYI